MSFLRVLPTALGPLPRNAARTGLISPGSSPVSPGSSPTNPFSFGFVRRTVLAPERAVSVHAMSLSEMEARGQLFEDDVFEFDEDGDAGRGIPISRAPPSPVPRSRTNSISSVSGSGRNSPMLSGGAISPVPHRPGMDTVRATHFSGELDTLDPHRWH